jgi:hypothetical protein
MSGFISCLLNDSASASASVKAESVPVYQCKSRGSASVSANIKAERELV